MINCNAENCKYCAEGECTAKDVVFRVFEDENNVETMCCKTFKYESKKVS